MSEEKIRYCGNCKHKNVDGDSQPCVDCVSADDHWEPIQEDVVNHPTHYTHGTYECIDVMEDCFGKEAVQHFCLLNAFKYLWRTNHKNGLEDIKKARWYLDKYLQLALSSNEG
jgi:hypothetical protein